MTAFNALLARAPVLAFLVLLAVGAVAGSWHTRQSRAVPLAPVEPPTTPLDAVGRPLDPEFVAAMKTETGPKRWLRMVAASEEATAAEFPALMRMAEGDYTATKLIAARWAEVDPRHMFKSLHALLLQPKEKLSSGTRSAMIDSLFETWGRNDPAAVIKAMNEVPDFSARDELRQRAVYELAKSNPAATFEAMAQWKVNYYPNSKKLKEWAEKDPAAAALAVQKLGNQPFAPAVLQVIGKAWADSDPQAALRHAESLSPNARTALASHAIAAWAKTDPQGAAAYAAGQKNAGYRAALGGMVAHSMGETDPAGAIAWSQSNLRGQGRDSAITGVVTATAAKSPAQAAQLVAGMEEGPTKARAGDGLFRTWFALPNQRQSAVQWLLSQPDEEMRRSSFSRVEYNWVREDPVGAAEFLTGPNGHLGSTSMASNVARTWATSSPETAMAKAARLPENQAVAARTSIVSTWMTSRPEAAMSYFNQLPPGGQERQSVIATVTQSISYNNPERAATFIRGLTGEEAKYAQTMLQQIDPSQRAKIEAALQKP